MDIKEYSHKVSLFTIFKEKKGKFLYPIMLLYEYQSKLFKACSDVDIAVKVLLTPEMFFL